MVKLKNAMNPFLFPPMAGILIAIIFFGALSGFFVPPQVPGNYRPVWLEPPKLVMSSVADTEDLNLTAPVVIQADIDATGRVQHYDVISGPDNDEVRSQLNRALLFTSFSPAYAFGQPVSGTAVISFSHVNVKGRS